MRQPHFPNDMMPAARRRGGRRARARRRLRRRRRRRRRRSSATQPPGRPGPADLPLRHLRRRDAVDRHAAHARGDRRRGRSDHRVVGRPEGRCRGAAAQRRGDGIQDGSIGLTSPATTMALLKLNAVVGLKGTVEIDQRRRHAHAASASPARCAIRRSTIRSRPASASAWTAGRTATSTPAPSSRCRRRSTPAQKAVFNCWGSGKYDPRLQHRRPEQAGGHPAGVRPGRHPQDHLHRRRRRASPTGTAMSAVTQMGGHGTFTEPRLGISVTNGTDDLVSGKLPALQAYQLSLAAPRRTGGQLRCRRGRARQAGVRGQGPMRDLPQRRASSPMPTRGCIRPATRWPSPRRRATPRVRRPSSTGRRR